MLITTDVGEEENVLTQIMKNPNVTEAHIVTGAHDIIAKISTPHFAEAIRNTVNIRKLDGVKITQTLICIRHMKRQKA